MKPTIREVAQASGVSAMAVSYVLHGTGKNVRVGKETAEKIRRVAKELHYQPNNLARSLRNRQTHMIGVVFQHFGRLSESNPYYPMLLNGVMSALFPQKYTLALCPELVQGGNEQAIMDGRFDGILWARPDFSHASIETLRNTNIPLVLLHAPPGSAQGIPSFCADNDGALKLVVRHLRDLGHRHISFVVNQPVEQSAESKARVNAFHYSVQDEGLQGEVFVWNEDTEALKEFFVNQPDVTAMICFSDALAGTLLQICESLKIAVPGQLSVVGFDSSSFCESTRPRLTSIHQPVELIAREAVTHLLELVKANVAGEELSATTSTTYKCTLDIRDSTGPAPNKN